MVTKSLVCGIAIGVLLMAGCGATFTYRYFGLAPMSYDGMLLGPTASQDIPFSACAPKPGVARPCVVVFASEWFRLKADYQSLVESLKSCQNARPAH